MSWDVCRICLAGNVKMHSIANTQLLEIYEKITNSQWNRDERPDSICYICHSQLTRCIKLREMSKQSEGIFAQFFAGGFEFTEETIPILTKRKLHTFLLAPVQAFSIGIIPNDCINENEEGMTIKLENNPDAVLEDISLENNNINHSARNKEVTSDKARPSSQKEFKTSNGTFQKSPHKKNYIKHSPQKKVTVKENEIKIPASSPNDIETNEVSESNMKIKNKLTELKSVNKNGSSDKDGTIKNADKTDHNIKSENKSSICFKLLFNLNRNDNSKTLFTRKKPLPLGVLNQSIETVKKPYTCEYCDKKFTFKYSLEEHISTHEEKPYFCEICNSAFSQQHLYKLHKNSHSKPYACDECPKKFHRLTHLNQHLKRHNNIKSYTCEHCEKSFRQISNLWQHLRTHTGEKPFICDICNKSFKQKSNLLQHNRVHTREKPFSCQICFKTFGQLSNLVQHRRIHDGEKPYSCDYCVMAFRQKSNLLQHIRHTHSKKVK